MLINITAAKNLVNAESSQKSRLSLLGCAIAGVAFGAILSKYVQLRCRKQQRKELNNELLEDSQEYGRQVTKNDLDPDGMIVAAAKIELLKNRIVNLNFRINSTRNNFNGTNFFQTIMQEHLHSSGQNLHLGHPYITTDNLQGNNFQNAQLLSATIMGTACAIAAYMYNG